MATLFVRTLERATSSQVSTIAATTATQLGSVLLRHPDNPIAAVIGVSTVINQSLSELAMRQKAELSLVGLGQLEHTTFGLEHLVRLHPR